MKKLIITLATLFTINLNAITIFSPTENAVFSPGSEIFLLWQGEVVGNNKVNISLFREGGILPEITPILTGETSEGRMQSWFWKIPGSFQPGKYTFHFQEQGENFLGLRSATREIQILPQAKITYIRRESQEEFHVYLEAEGLPGFMYMVQGSTDMKKWYDLAGTDADIKGKIRIGVRVGNDNLVLGPIFRGPKVFFRFKTL